MLESNEEVPEDLLKRFERIYSGSIAKPEIKMTNDASVEWTHARPPRVRGNRCCYSRIYLEVGTYKLFRCKRIASFLRNRASSEVRQSNGTYQCSAGETTEKEN